MKINNIEVVRVEAQLGSVNCTGWKGVIEPNQSASIAVEEKISHGGNTTGGITILTGKA